MKIPKKLKYIEIKPIYVIIAVIIAVTIRFWGENSMRCPAFEPLIQDMIRIVQNGYEVLVAIHKENWGCVLNIDKNYFVEMDSYTYHTLCRILGLNWKNDGFNSAVFLRLLSEKSPQYSNCRGVDYKDLRLYIPYRSVEEKDKIYF